jgi:hypothetical protein
MYPQPYPHKIVLLTTGFRYQDRRLFFARARLFFDRVELSGWQPGERHLSVIPLDAVRRVDWLPAQAGANVVLHLEDGTSLPLFLEEASLWQHLLEHRLRWSARTFPVPPSFAPSFERCLTDPAAYACNVG